jgi:DNA-directed RNA polymerase specialized sigma24 family protein
MPLEPWLELMTEREIAEAPGGDAAAPPPTLALAQEEFAAAVRQALRDLRRPEQLAANPLARTRVVQAHAAPAPADALAALLREAVDALQGDPRDEKLHRVLDRTYLRPAPTQERAAELLDLPLSTYRRHLARGVDRVARWLWQRELYGE